MYPGKSQVVLYDRGEVQLLVVGHEDGSIQVFSVRPGADPGAGPRCRLLANIKTQAKLIQSLALHPPHSADGSPAQFCNYLASASYRTIGCRSAHAVVPLVLGSLST